MWPDWDAQRQAGMEQVLAEQVGLRSWRLNRVVLYGSERASGLQEGAMESVRERRKRRLGMEQILARPGDKVLTDVGVLLEAPAEQEAPR